MPSFPPLDAGGFIGTACGSRGCLLVWDLAELRTRSEIITGMYLEVPSSLDSSGEMSAAFRALCFPLKCLETVELLHTVSQIPF